MAVPVQGERVVSSGCSAGDQRTQGFCALTKVVDAVLGWVDEQDETLAELRQHSARVSDMERAE